MTDANKRYGPNGEQRNRGIELSAFGELAPNLRVLGGVTYIDAELTKTQGGKLDGKRPDGTPDLTAALNIEWDPQAVPGLTLGVRGEHTDSQFVLGDKKTTLPSYQIYGLNARYTQEINDQPVTFRANVNNLFDKRYWTAAPKANQTTLHMGTPRTISFSASVNF